MRSNFNSALDLVLSHEGGWSDHPRDPGGATMKGVTLETYRRHFGEDKSKEDLRNITDPELEAIYKRGYWDKCKCDDLPDGVDYAVFDAAVNSGPKRAAKWLQAAIDADMDGIIGPQTLMLARDRGAMEVIMGLCSVRISYLRSLSNWAYFGAGWQNRVDGVKLQAIRMCKDNNK